MMDMHASHFLASSSTSSGVPDIPNMFTLVRLYFGDEPWTELLYKWEAIIFSFFIAVALSLFFYFGTRKREMLPFGLQNFLETVVEVFKDFIVNILGPDGVKYVPFLGTLFIYILTMNLAGLVPLMKAPSANINVTIALSLCVFAYVQYLNIKHMGVKGFLYHLAGSPKDAAGWIIAPLMFPIELLTQISRPVTLALRLFGNILGEKILVGFFAAVGAAFLYFFPIQTPFMLFGLLTGIIQAVVFTLLSTIYILLSMPHEEENENTNH